MTVGLYGGVHLISIVLFPFKMMIVHGSYVGTLDDLNCSPSFGPARCVAGNVNAGSHPAEAIGSNAVSTTLPTKLPKSWAKHEYHRQILRSRN